MRAGDYGEVVVLRDHGQAVFDGRGGDACVGELGGPIGSPGARAGSGGPS